MLESHEFRRELGDTDFGRLPFKVVVFSVEALRE